MGYENEPAKKEELTEQEKTAGIAALQAQRGLIGISGFQLISSDPRKALRRIYVGNLPLGSSTTFLKHTINNAMQAEKIAISDSVADVFVNSSTTNRFALVEFRTVEESNRCITHLNGKVELFGQILEFSRPWNEKQANITVTTIPKATLDSANASLTQQQLLQQKMLLQQKYFAQIQQLQAQQAQLTQTGVWNGIGTIGGINPLAAAAAAQATLLASQASGAVVEQVSQEEAIRLTHKRRRVRVTNLPRDDDLVDGLSTFLSALMKALQLTINEGNPIISVTLDDDKVGALVEFRTVREAQNARQNLGGLKYGDKSLQVEWPPDYSPLTDEQMKGCIGTGILGLDGEIELALGGGKTNAAESSSSAAGSKPKESEATKVVVLSNLLSEAELQDEQESLDVLEDTREKCDKDFGEVQSAIVITPVIGGGSDAIEDKWYGKTMVHFKDEKVAFKAATSLHGLKFDGRPVHCSFITEEVYEKIHEAVEATRKKQGEEAK